MDSVKSAEEKMMDNNSLDEFSPERIEFGREVGSLNESTIISCKKSNIISTSGDPFSQRFQSLAEDIGRWLLNDDETIDVLSRLPIESVLEMKFVCKWWNHLTSRPYFRNAHFQKSPQNIISGIFLQGLLRCNCCDYYLDTESVDYVAFGAERKFWVKNDTLNFLPEKVVIMASCNGLLICRSLFRRDKKHRLLQREVQNAVDAEPFSADAQLPIYVCNPFTKEFSILKPNITNKEHCGVGFAFHSLEHFSSCFEIVVVQVLQKAKSSFCYMFKIYSSKSETWRVSKESCIYPYNLFLHWNVFVKGVFYWLTTGRSILTFDLKREKSELINLPGPLSKYKSASGMCLGQSEGFLHYIFLSACELRVWILKSDHSKPEWDLKYFWHVSCFGKLVHPRNWKGYGFSVRADCYTPNDGIRPLGFFDDVLIVWHLRRLWSFDPETGIFSELVNGLNAHSCRQPVLLSYSRSLLPVCSDLKSSFN